MVKKSGENNDVLLIKEKLRVDNPPPDEEDDTGEFKFGNPIFRFVDLFAYAQHGNWGSWYYGTAVCQVLVDWFPRKISQFAH